MKKQCPVISAIYIYPVKSLRAISVHSTTLTPRGFLHDRRCMLVRPSRSTHGPPYRFITQRQCSALATITVSLPSAPSPILKLSTINATISIDISEDVLCSSPKVTAGVWEDVVTAVDLGDAPAHFVQTVMHTHDNVRVVSLLPQTHRTLDERYLPPASYPLDGSIPQVSFADGFPILLTSEESLDALNVRLRNKHHDPLPMSRFRPNLVVKGLHQPFDEDHWKTLHIGLCLLHVVKGCPRCKQSCIDQMSGKRDVEPLQTLGEFRRKNEDARDQVFFGQNVVGQKDGVGKVISVGDRVRVLEIGEPVWGVEED